MHNSDISAIADFSSNILTEDSSVQTSENIGINLHPEAQRLEVQRFRNYRMVQGYPKL
jgi:hypothetical protein